MFWMCSRCDGCDLDAFWMPRGRQETDGMHSGCFSDCPDTLRTRSGCLGCIQDAEDEFGMLLDVLDTVWTRSGYPGCILDAEGTAGGGRDVFRMPQGLLE